MTHSDRVLLGRPLTLEDLGDVALRGRKVALDDDARVRVRQSRAAIDSLAAGGDAAPNVYGVNTGFGALAETRIGAADIVRLQKNLVRSHACAVGPDLPVPVVRAMLVLRAQVLAKGHSGVRDVVIDRLCQLLERGVTPRVPSQGSVGASGDLAPLAHLALCLLGEGEAYVGYQFACGWDDEHELGVMTHRGRVVSIGGGDTAFLSWIAKRDGGVVEGEVEAPKRAARTATKKKPAASKKKPAASKKKPAAKARKRA